MCYIHLACRAAKQRRVHSCRRKRRSANSVAASLPRRSVAAPTASQRHWPNGSVAALQRHPPPERRSVAASQRHPPPGASQRNVGNPRFGPLCPCTAIFYAHKGDQIGRCRPEVSWDHGDQGHNVGMWGPYNYN